MSGLFANTMTQISDKFRVGEVTRFCRTPKCLSHHVDGNNGRTKQRRGYLCYLRPLLIVLSRPRERRRSADTLKLARIQPLARPPHKHGNIGALAPTVRVEFV